MYIWEVLGIECTTDVVAIKRAFAQKAKLYHPEEHPEEYKKLRNAYKKAIESDKLVPIIEPEVSIDAINKENCEKIKFIMKVI